MWFAWGFFALVLPGGCAGTGGDDTMPPRLEILGGNPLALLPGDEFRYPGARVVDDRDGKVDAYQAVNTRSSTPPAVRAATLPGLGGGSKRKELTTA